MCELDIIFNFEKAYYILDEFILGGEAQETSKKNVLKAIEQADMLQEVRNTHIACYLFYFSKLLNSFSLILISNRKQIHHVVFWRRLD